MASAMSGLYKGVDCPQQIATHPSVTDVPYPVWRLFDCPLCKKEHAFTFQLKRFVSTPSQYTKFKSHCALYGIKIEEEPS